MSRFLSGKLKRLVPYVPGEQPKGIEYIKLNTNESPFPPSQAVLNAIDTNETSRLNLYSDPTLSELRHAIAERYGVSDDMVFAGNGSDEVLAFSFYAYGENGVTAPDISYGFYPVFADFFGIRLDKIPLRDNLSIDPEEFCRAKGTLVFANPNAQTGLYLEKSDIEKIVSSDRERIVIVDEAYIDFGGESAVSLTGKYDNLIVVQTFSKSRNLAGARVGFAIASPALVRDLDTLRNSYNPYNINRLSLIAGKMAMHDVEYFSKCTSEIIRVRELVKEEFRVRGFKVIDSMANFVLAESGRISGKDFYSELKSRGVLVRYLGDKRIENCVRITIGTEEQMRVLLKKTDEILSAITNTKQRRHGDENG